LLLSFGAAALPAPAFAQSQIAVVQDLYNNVLQFPKSGAPTMMNAAKGFYASGNPDDFDFLFVFLQGQGTFNDEGYLPSAYPIQKAPAGTGAPNPANSPADYGSGGKLKLVGDMYLIANYTSEPNDKYNYLVTFPASIPSPFSQVGMVARAMMRYWGAYLKLPGGNANGLIGGNGFWSFFLNTGSTAGVSVLGGHYFKKLGVEDFNMYSPTRILSQLDLYLMGVLPADEVEDTFYLINVEMDPPHQPSDFPDGEGGYVADGTKVPVTIEEIVQANGARAAASQTEFRCAFVLVIPANTDPQPTDLSKLEALRRRIQSWVNEQTDNEISLDCRLDQTPPDGDGTDGDVPGCAPGERRCNGKWVEECDANNNWDFLQDCGELLCIEDECVDPTQVDGDDAGPDCLPGQTRCDDDVVQRCDNEMWVDFQNCVPLDRVCQNSQCVDAPIGDGDTPADGDETVDGDGPAAECLTADDCPANNRCGSGQCIPCPVGTTLQGNVCFEGQQEENGGGGCQAAGAFSGALFLLAALGFAIRRRR